MKRFLRTFLLECENLLLHEEWFQVLHHIRRLLPIFHLILQEYFQSAFGMNEIARKWSQKQTNSTHSIAEMPKQIK